MGAEYMGAVQLKSSTLSQLSSQISKSTCPQNPKMKLLMPPLLKPRKLKLRKQYRLVRPLQPNPRPQKERLLKKRKKKKQPANKLSQILSSTSLITQINKSNPKDGVFTQYSSKTVLLKEKENISFTFKYEENLPYLIR